MNLGHDADITAAIAGGLVGLTYGYDAIRDVWLENLQAKQLIDMCCEYLNAHFRTIFQERQIGISGCIDGIYDVY